ncbi:MAG: hydroxymethylbilane synthase, partial [Planctomycetaceae bacterium]|nr:hydroxymethylbilane synthase [Planctomycetaceae bacterium]
MLIRLGTRGSRLALWQAGFVSELLERCGVDVEIVVVKTRGDIQQSGSIANIGATGVFTKEIQNELLNGRFDLAVHSLKDLPTDVVHGLRLAAAPVRGAVRDAFVSQRFTDISS